LLDLVIDNPIACLPVCVGGCPDSCVTDNEVSVSSKDNNTGVSYSKNLKTTIRNF